MRLSEIQGWQFLAQIVEDFGLTMYCIFAIKNGMDIYNEPKKLSGMSLSYSLSK